MATGDAAAAHGIPVVPGTRNINVGYNDINAVADALAGEMDTRSAAVQQETTTRINIDTLLGQAIDSLNAVVATKQAALGYRPVSDVTGQNSIGLRWNGVNPVIKVDVSEFELARLLDIQGAEARLNARMTRNGMGA
jgi:hypothetical protein